jgi:hypothetical protein
MDGNPDPELIANQLEVAVIRPKDVYQVGVIGQPYFTRKFHNISIS